MGCSGGSARAMAVGMAELRPAAESNIKDID